MSRHLMRIDPDNYEHFREQAHRSNDPGGATAIVNRLLRYAIPLADAGVFNLPHDVILTALERYGEQLLADAAAVAADISPAAAAQIPDTLPAPRPAPSTPGRRPLANRFKPVTPDR